MLRGAERGHYPAGSMGMDTFLDRSMAPEHSQRNEEYDVAGAPDAVRPLRHALVPVAAKLPSVLKPPHDPRMWLHMDPVLAGITNT